MTGRSRHAAGFTLLEILVTSALLALLLGGVYATYRAGVVSADQVERSNRVYQTGQALLTQMLAELRAVYVPVEVESAEEEPTPTPTPEGTSGPEAVGLPTPQAEEPMIQPEPETGGLEGLGNGLGQLNPLVGQSAESLSESGVEATNDRITIVTWVGPTAHPSDPATELAQVSYYIDEDETTPEEGLVRSEDRYLGLTEQDEGTRVEELSRLVVGLTFRYYSEEQQEWLQDWSGSVLPAAIQVNLIVADPEDESVQVMLTDVVTPAAYRLRSVGASLAEAAATPSPAASAEEPTPEAEPRPEEALRTEGERALEEAMRGGRGAEEP